MSKSENPEKSIIPNSDCVKTRLRAFAEVALVCVIVIGVWGLVSLPIIFYNLTKYEISSKINGSTNDDSLYSAPFQYATTSGICLTEFTNILRYSHCSHALEGNLLVLRNEEATATELINGLTSLGASAECLSKAVPFLCLHLFGLCGESGIPIQPTASQCEEIRDTTCKHQWMILERLDIGLPHCAMFPAESLSCPSLNDSLSINGTIATNMLDFEENYSNDTTTAFLECTGEFYRENGTSYCTRSCSNWVQFGNGFGIIYELLVILFLSISLLASAAVIIISCIAHKRMLIFPAIFIVYMCIDYSIVDILAIAGFMNRDKLFCTSRSLIKSLTEVTPFCVISGISSRYIYCQMGLWWLFHTASLFWNVIFPIHARSFKISGKNKYIHMTSIILGILLPIFTIITIMADTAVNLRKQDKNSTSQIRTSLLLSQGLGFGYTRFPPIVCSSTNSDAHFYSVIVVIDLIFGCGSTMLIIIFRSIHKLYVKRKKVQKNLNFKASEGLAPQFTFGTAEKKLLSVLSYSVLMIAVAVTSNTWNTKTGSDSLNNTLKFLICEQGVHNSSNACINSNVSIGYNILRTLSAILLSCIPFVSLVYVVNIQELKELWKKLP